MRAARRRLPGWVRSLLALIVALTVLRVVEWLIWPTTPETEFPARPPPALRRWDFVGCYDLRVDAWSFGRYVASPDSATLARLTPPTRIMLLPDSLDEWGRAYRTLRAVPQSGEFDAELLRSLRWFTRADTLWLVWSAGPTRVGVALFDHGDSLVGRGAALRADSAQGTALAAAWRINCATSARERSAPYPRRYGRPR